jgi:hypothetical protein
MENSRMKIFTMINRCNDYVKNTSEISYQLNDSPHAHNCATQRTLWAAEWHFSCNETERQNQQTDRNWLTLKME